jgi:hypothetical protein
MSGRTYSTDCYCPGSYLTVYPSRSNAKIAVYERLFESRPEGYHVFANMILAGNILCSSLFPNRRTLVLPYKDGQILALHLG